MLILVVQVVLSKLAGHIAERLEQSGNRRVLGPHAQVCTWKADLGKTRAKHALTGDERRAAGSAALLAVIIGEHHALTGDTVDVGCPVAPQPHGVGADVGLANVIAPDNQDVGFIGFGGSRTRER